MTIEQIFPISENTAHIRKSLHQRKKDHLENNLYKHEYMRSQHLEVIQHHDEMIKYYAGFIVKKDLQNLLMKQHIHPKAKRLLFKALQIISKDEINFNMKRRA